MVKSRKEAAGGHGKAAGGGGEAAASTLRRSDRVAGQQPADYSSALAQHNQYGCKPPGSHKGRMRPQKKAVRIARQQAIAEVLASGDMAAAAAAAPGPGEGRRPKGSGPARSDHYNCTEGLHCKSAIAILQVCAAAMRG
jgi:hypothetical protein